jgi:hypothetical protein
VRVTNERLPAGVRFDTHYLLSARRAHDIEDATHPEFVHAPRFGSPQYSDAFAGWMVEQYERDNRIVADARRRYYQMNR